MSSSLAFSPAPIAAARPPPSHEFFSSSSSSAVSAATGPMALLSSMFVPLPLSACRGRGKCASPISSSMASRTKTMVRCDAAVKSVASVDADADPSSPSPSPSSEIGARVRVSVSLKVYHVPRVPEVDLTGMEGVIKDYVAVWKGKRISANLPYKVQFVKEIEGRGPVKFIAHLKEEEFEFIDQ